MYLKQNKSDNERFQKLIQKSEYIKSKIYKVKKSKYLIFNNNRIEFIDETNETALGYFEYDKCFKVSIRCIY